MAGTLALVSSQISSDVLNIVQGARGNAGGVRVSVVSALTLDSMSSISSDTNLGTLGNAGQVDVRGREVRLAGASSITSNTDGNGNAGTVVVVGAGTVAQSASQTVAADSAATPAGQGPVAQVGLPTAAPPALGNGALTLGGGSSISSNSAGGGNGGGVRLSGGALGLSGGSQVTTDATGTGNAGQVAISATSLTLDQSKIQSESASQVGGTLDIGLSGALALNASQIRTNATGAGPAGDVLIAARTATLDNRSVISSSAAPGSTGRSGTVTLTVGEALTLSGVSAISTASANSRDAGTITIMAGEIDLIGSALPNLPDNPSNARITSSNTGTGNAGNITIRQTTPGLESGITLAEGAVITTSSRTANAGQITIDMAPGTILRLIGRTENALIDTSSPVAPSSGNEGGRVLIGQTSAPYAVILNGGSILALGQTDKDNLRINAGFLIRSADRENRIAIGNGEEVDSQFEDVSSGIVSTDLDVVDASRVLSGACPVGRTSGQYSQFLRTPVGPYAPEPQAEAPEPPPAPLSLSQTGTALALRTSLGGCR